MLDECTAWPRLLCRTFASIVRRSLRREVVLPAVGRAGHDLVIARGQLPASIAAVFLLNALHVAFPGVRLLLIAGLPGIQVVGKPHGAERGR